MFSSQNSQVSNDIKYIEDFCSVYLRTGTGASQTVTTGVKENTGALVISKSRSAATDWAWYDTFRGATYDLVSNSAAAQTTQSQGLTAFNADGHTWGTLAKINTSGATYVDTVLKPTPKFFDVVTAARVSGQTNARISHNLGSVPGFVIVKSTDYYSESWRCYHRSLGRGSTIQLNLTDAAVNISNYWGTSDPTSTDFGINWNLFSGDNYVFYFFAHDAGGFGLTGTDNVISCGSYTGNGSATGPTVTLGYEPQWVLVKRTDSTSNWTLSDNMRGQPVDGATAILYPNLSDAEASATTAVSPTATGFQVKSAGTTFNASGGTYIYIAIRRGPMKVPTSGTSVFDPVLLVDGSTNIPPVNSTINAPDLAWSFARNAVYGYGSLPRDRLSSAGMSYLQTSSTAAEASYSAYTFGFTTLQKGIDGANSGSTFNQASPGVIYWMFGRAPSFFDVVCYTGTGSATTVTHNLAVVPEMMIVKDRSQAGNWTVYNSSLGNTKYLRLNSTIDAITDPVWNNTTPTTTVFSVGSGQPTNGSGATYVAYLFATCAGVSKVGSYTGTGATLQVDCGFTGGARFVLIKRTDSTGDWYVWDTARGIVSGNDPYLLLNSAAAEVTNTDYIDTYSAGFEISSTAPAAINASGGTFIFLAIA